MLHIARSWKKTSRDTTAPNPPTLKEKYRQLLVIGSYFLQESLTQNNLLLVSYF